MRNAAAAAALLLLFGKNHVEFNPPGTLTQGGITSLAYLKTNNDDGFVVCGTKEGSVQVLSLDDEDSGDCFVCYELNNITKKGTRSAILSMTVDEDSRTLICGGSDRFVTIWQLETVTTDNTRSRLILQQQRLGPHTGWVRDVLFVAEPDVLYSIGCNCIESWYKAPSNYQSNQQQQQQQWKQGKRWIVNSDPALGCTLSSDLLCLAITNGCLLAGGVDGRVHKFGTQGQSAIAAHDGRINALEATHGGVVSVSHDGWVHKWSLQQENNEHMNLKRVQSFQSNERNTAIVSLQINDNEECFVVGTSRGTILLLSDSLDLLAKYQLPQCSAITSLLHVPHRQMVLVAHSQGLAALKYVTA